MDYKTAFKQIKMKHFKPVYLCYGTESYLLRQFVQQLQKQCVEPGHEEFAISKYDLKETPIRTVIEDAEMPAFMVERKIIIAENATFFTGSRDTSKVEHHLDQLQKYLESPVNDSTIVFIVEADKLDERKKLVKTLKKQDGVIVFQPLHEKDLKLWVKQRVQKNGCQITEDAVIYLLESAGTQLQRLEAETDKLILFAGKGQTLQKAHVEALVVRNTEENVFQLIEYIVEKKAGDALSLFYSLLKQNESPIKILALMARQYRMILQAKQLRQQGYSDAQIASYIGVHPYVAKRCGEQGRKYNENKLAMILQRIAELDYNFKTGRIAQELGLELFILEISA